MPDEVILVTNVSNRDNAKFRFNRHLYTFHSRPWWIYAGVNWTGKIRLTGVQMTIKSILSTLYCRVYPRYTMQKFKSLFGNQ